MSNELLNTRDALEAMLNGDKISSPDFTDEEFLYIPYYDELDKEKVLSKYDRYHYVEPMMVMTEDGYHFGDMFNKPSHPCYNRWYVTNK